jgi:TolA-binding protein
VAALLPSGAGRIALTAPGRAPLSLDVAIEPHQVVAMRYELPDLSQKQKLDEEQPSSSIIQNRSTTKVRLSSLQKSSTQPVTEPSQEPPKQPRAATEPAPLDAGATPPPPSQQPTSPPKETAESLYALAERAMRSGDPAAARAHLRDVARRFPDDPLADAALYELARAAPPREARALLAQLRDRDPALREPARFLRCRLDVDERLPGAADCLAAFRHEFAGSPHDAEALALEAGLREARGDCRRALPLLDEYLERYPRGPFAAQAAARRVRCRP